MVGVATPVSRSARHKITHRLHHDVLLLVRPEPRRMSPRACTGLRARAAEQCTRGRSGTWLHLRARPTTGRRQRQPPGDLIDAGLDPDGSVLESATRPPGRDLSQVRRVVHVLGRDINGRGGIRTPRRNQQILQSAPFGHLAIRPKVGGTVSARRPDVYAGRESPTGSAGETMAHRAVSDPEPTVGGESTAHGATRGSNRRPAVYKTVALPAELAWRLAGERGAVGGLPAPGTGRRAPWVARTREWAILDSNQ